jgi:hypothetical protein
MLVDGDDAVIPLVGRFRGTVTGADRFFAIVTQTRQEVAACVREDTLLHDLQPGGVNLKRHRHLRLAGNTASVTADASANVYYHSVSFISHLALFV